MRNLMTIDRPGLTLMQWLDDIYKVFVRINGDVIFTPAPPVWQISSSMVVPARLTTSTAIHRPLVSIRSTDRWKPPG